VCGRGSVVGLTLILRTTAFFQREIVEVKTTKAISRVKTFVQKLKTQRIVRRFGREFLRRKYRLFIEVN